MTYPRTFFASATEAERPGSCFVLMPFTPELEPVYATIRNAVQADDVGFTCTRADELYGGDQVMVGVLRGIAHAQLVITDLSGRNPNVFYELGVAHITKDAERVLLLTQNMDDVPFDLRAYRCIQYTLNKSGLVTLGERVTAAAKAVAGHTYRFTIGVMEIHKTEPIFPGRDRHLYSLEVRAGLVGWGLVKCWVRAWRYRLGEQPAKVEDDHYAFLEAESRDVKNFPWRLRLERIIEDHAAFAVVPPGTDRDGNVGI